MNRKLIYIGVVAVAVIAAIYFLTSATEADSGGIVVPVSQGEFIVDITTTGELEAKKSVEILGPQGTRNYRIWNMTIQEIIDEGTFVKKGDFVASIDPTELTNKIKDSQLELEKIESQFIQTKLDTTLDMRKARDELINLSYAVDERQLVLDQSQYEPPATIRQAEIDLDKARRALEQAKENYKIKKEQNKAKMQEVALNRQKEVRNLEGMQGLMQSFTITAPEDGMLIYKKEYDGTSIKQGSQISAWDPVVATLPDLSTMISTTYVNEVDIRQVQVGQNVEIGLDAFPEKEFSGKVFKVANVGEQRPNSDAKVFKVVVEVNEKDDLLRPSMTTSNRIITSKKDDQLYIPLECLFNKDDTITYVYKKVGLGAARQEVNVGSTNRNEVIILGGLSEGDDVYMSRAEAAEDTKISLLPELDGKRSKKTKALEEETLPPTDNSEQSPGEAAGEKRTRKPA
ncbi:MAG: efflux RND transporter periplasmic adaptor subunit [Cryomorphaceae bacterium]|nr:efflux RND transporter periplasmic adaptor subunit [Flavobacteriales bacterium]